MCGRISPERRIIYILFLFFNIGFWISAAGRESERRVLLPILLWESLLVYYSSKEAPQREILTSILCKWHLELEPGKLRCVILIVAGKLTASEQTTTVHRLTTVPQQTAECEHWCSITRLNEALVAWNKKLLMCSAIRQRHATSWEEMDVLVMINSTPHVVPFIRSVTDYWWYLWYRVFIYHSLPFALQFLNFMACLHLARDEKVSGDGSIL